MIAGLTSRSHRRTSETGFSLVEVLIAVLVLSVGLLGLAGLQMAGLHNNYQSYLRTQAVNTASDIADRMRANRAEAMGGSYDVAMTGSLTQPGTQCSGGAATDCSPAQIAAEDQYDFIDLANDLPSGQGSIQRINVAGRPMVRITVQWDQSRDPNSNDIVQFVWDSEL